MRSFSARSEIGERRLLEQMVPRNLPRVAHIADTIRKLGRKSALNVEISLIHKLLGQERSKSQNGI